jgi:KDO2-lipid IV(A) lauroyltransferase
MAQYGTTVDRVVYIAVRLAAMILQMFPINLNLATARLAGRIWYRLIPRHRRRARGHLRLAYGHQLSDAQIDRIAMGSMQQMAMMAVESVFSPRLINEWTWPRYIRLRGIERVLEVLLSRRGVILLTGHYGNWELLGITLTALGFPLVAVMRPLDNPFLNDYLMTVRRRRGLELLYKKGASQSAEDVLRGGGILGFIADQNAGRKGEFVDFFSQPASTYRSIALLAIACRVPIAVGYARRLSHEFAYEVGCNRIIEPDEWAWQENAVHWITQEYTRAIEQLVRDAPEQYLWIHRRWKSRPRPQRAAAQRSTAPAALGAAGASTRGPCVDAADAGP